MPIDPIASQNPVTPAPQPKAPAKTLPTNTLNEPSFSSLVNQDLKSGLKSGPRLTPSADDGFKSTQGPPSRFIPLNRGLTAAGAPLKATSVEALGATTKHPLGPQKR